VPPKGLSTIRFRNRRDRLIVDSVCNFQLQVDFGYWPTNKGCKIKFGERKWDLLQAIASKFQQGRVTYAPVNRDSFKTEMASQILKIPYRTIKRKRIGFRSNKTKLGEADRPEADQMPPHGGCTTARHLGWRRPS
jgi:hypothetical protein